MISNSRKRLLKESAMLALEVHKVLHADFKTQREWIRNGVKEWRLGNGDGVWYTMEMDGYWSVIVIRHRERERRAQYKVLPRAVDGTKAMEKVLNAQPWITE